VPTQHNTCPACGHVRDWKQGRDLSAGYGTTDWNAHGREVPRKLTANGKQAQVGNNQTIDAGWVQGCSCDNTTVAAPIVLDPFGGSGTTALVANRMGRNAIMLELNPDYAQMAYTRLTDAELVVEMV
jgi:hypothetical protein